MLKVIAFALAAGAGFEAWRNYPADGPASARSLWLLFCVGVVAAYLGGRWHGRRHVSASAWASAHAEASAESTATAQQAQTVNVALVVPGGGARPSGVRSPGDEVSWLGAPRAAVSVDDLDGLDLAELVQDQGEGVES